MITSFIVRYFFSGHIEKGIAMVLKLYTPDHCFGGGCILLKNNTSRNTVVQFFLKLNFNYNNVPLCILLGIAAGFIPLCYARFYKKTEGKVHG